MGRLMESADRAFQSLDLGAETTLFYRSSLDGMEGFVVDNTALVATLKERVLAERGLSEVADVMPYGSRAGSVAVRDAHSHEFADPFTSVQAHLSLTPLETPFTEQILLPLTFVLGLLIVLGLWALYRVVATQLVYAERQSNFVAAVTHELKTPLTAIRMHGEMLQDGLVESPEKAQESYRTITAQAERLSRLISNVLLLSKIERQVAPAPKKGGLATIVRGAEAVLGPHVSQAGFTLHLDIPEKVPEALVDADAVEQILWNLIDNAIKYAKPAEDKRLTVAIDVAEKSILLSVRDRGPGVPDGEHKHIFEPFYRLEDELTRKSQGTGLGLALVSDLAARMGATVHAKNAHPGFQVTIEFERTPAQGSSVGK